MAVSAAAPRLSARGDFADPLLWIGVAAYATVLYVLGAIRYAAHRNFVDLGIFAQTSASAFGCFCNTVEGSHWGVHFSPILYLAGAFVHVWPSALALVALQAAACALTIPAVYGIVRRCADRRAARLAALVVALYPPLAGLAFNDFHENGLAPAAVAWMLWAFDAGALLPFSIFAMLTLAVKEDQAVFVAAGGLLGFFRYRGSYPRGPLALATAAVAAALFLVFFFRIQPAAAHAAHWAPTRFYTWTQQDVRALFPGGIVQRAGFFILAFGPLLFLPLRSRLIALAILPLCEVLLSRDSTTFTMGSHYAGAWIGYVFFAFAGALRPIFARDPRRAYRLLIWCAALCAVEFLAADPLHPGYFLRAPGQRDAALERVLRGLPAAASIATQEEAYTHLAATDPNATVLPETPAGAIDACYLLTDSEYPDSPRLVESAPLVESLVARRVYRIDKRQDGIILYTKAAGCP